MLKSDGALLELMPYPRQLNDDKEKEIAEAYLSGATIRDLKDKHHLGDKLIRNAVRRQGVKFRPLGTRGSTIKMPKESRALGYIAGLLDGEGHITWGSHKHRKSGKYPHVGITNTNSPVLKYLETFGGKVTWRPDRGKFSACGTWQIDGTLNIIEFLRSVLPSLIIKKKKAEEMLAELEKRVEGGFKCE
jgi:hypothetical protein